MTITPEDIQRTAHLARLELTPDGVIHFGRDLQQILEYIDHLREVDVSDVELSGNITVGREGLREDRVLPSLSRDDALANAPEITDGMFRVPRVIG